MKTTLVTKIVSLHVLGAGVALACAGVALTGCTLQADDDQTQTGSPENTEESSQHGEIPFGIEDFTYVTEDGTIVQCIGSAGSKGLSCDWEGATRPSDAEDSASDEDAESEQSQ